MCLLDDAITDAPSNKLKKPITAARARAGENRPRNPKSSGPVELIKLNSPFPLHSPSNYLCLPHLQGGRGLFLYNERRPKSTENKTSSVNYPPIYFILNKKKERLGQKPALSAGAKSWVLPPK